MATLEQHAPKTKRQKQLASARAVKRRRSEGGSFEANSDEQERSETQEKQKKSEKEKQRWKSHPLYRFKTKNQLELMCKQQKLPFISSMAKYELVQLISHEKRRISTRNQF